MIKNQLRDLPDRDLEVIVKAQSHHPRYLDAMKEYVARQEIKYKKEQQRSRFNLYLTIFIAVLTLLLVYFTIGVPHYQFNVPFASHPQSPPNK